MNFSQILLLLAIFVLVVMAVLVAASLLRGDRTQQRLRAMVGSATVEAKDSQWMETVARVAGPVSRLAMPEEGFEQSNVKLRFIHAGMRNPAAPTVFFGVKAALALGLPLLTWMLLTAAEAGLQGTNLLACLLLAATIGYYAPNLWLAHHVETRQREIFENFPDALDLMTVCVEAGLGTESAMVRVAEDLQFKSPALAEELRIVNLELRAGADRALALRNFAFRTGVEEVDGFVSMINQAERFGTSVAASLRIHSELLRTRRRQRAEEAAAKIALKLLFPLIFCIFPALMVVLMGPAAIQIRRVLLPAVAGMAP